MSKRIRLGNELLSEQESDYIRELANRARLTVKEYIKASGGEKKIIAFLQKSVFHEDSFTNYKPVLNRYEKKGFRFKIGNEIVSKAVMDNYINQLYLQYHDEIYTDNRLIHIDFKVNYRDETVSVYIVELYDRIIDSEGKESNNYNVSDIIFDSEDIEDTGNEESEENEGEELEVIERKGKYFPIRRDQKGRFRKNE